MNKMLALAVGTSLLASAQSGLARIASTTANYSITLESDCTVSATGAVFPNQSTGVSGKSGVPAGKIEVTCTPGVSYGVGMDAGQHYNGGYRGMQRPEGERFNYNLCSHFYISGGAMYCTNIGDRLSSYDSIYTTTYDDYPVIGTGTGELQTYPLTACLNFGANSMPPGTYTDTVKVVLAF